LKAALEFPWDKWTIFLHPSQREWVDRDFVGPSRVSGSAGTGKTIVALHRAVSLARQNRDARVLLTTFSDPLASALHARLRRLIGSEPRLGERIDVLSMHAVGVRLYGLHIGKLKLASTEAVRQAIREVTSSEGAGKFGLSFLASEWSDVVDAWQLKTWEEYRTVARLGRKTRLSEAQRQSLWQIFEAVNQRLHATGAITAARMYTSVAEKLQGMKQPPYDFIVVDESQDISVAQIRFLAAMGAAVPNRLFFAGDLGQRIYQMPFSWLSLGVDIRGRSRTLRVNYRTSHQIRTQADRLLGPQVTDVDGNAEDRRGTVSLFNGPPPRAETFADEATEITGVASWLTDQQQAGTAAHEIGIIVRSENEVARATAAAKKAGLPFVVIDQNAQPTSGSASVLTMHLAKGLEFKAVAVMACDDEVVPLQSRIEAVTDDSDLEEVYNTERHLLYVACTRARDHLLVTSVAPASEFLDDLQDNSARG
jgi:superfamily I DNA/RNA helicase